MSGGFQLSYLEIIAVIKDVILSVAAITGAVVAVRGLNTWQRQLKGQTEHELAKHLLISLFKYRDALSNVRNPVILSSEMSSPSNEERQYMSPEKLNAYQQSIAYQARFKKVIEERSSLYIHGLEAEALWGETVNKMLQNIYVFDRKLQLNILLFLKSLDESPRINESHFDTNIIYARHDKDEFWDGFTSEVTQMEKYLKPKLK